MRRSSRASIHRTRRGGVLVEFALVAFAIYLVLAAIIDMGRVVMSAQVLQSAADKMARELGVAPLDGLLTFEEALDTPYVKQRIYDENALVVDLNQHPPGPALDAHFASLPVVNQMLRPLMVSDELPGGTPVLRYPGAVVSSDDGYTVQIPRILARNDQGHETAIEWLPVVEEVLPQGQGSSSFPVNAPTGALRGHVVLRLNYPYQAAALTAFDPQGTEGPVGDVIEAADSIPDLPPGAIETVGPAPNRGPGGLGYHYAFVGSDGAGKKVRPYRKLISVRSIHRRENYGG